MAASQLGIVWFTIVLFCSYASLLTNGQYLATVEDLDNWLETTTATVEFIGVNDFSTPPGPLDVRLIYCSERLANTNTCGGTCFAYQGPGSQCMLPVLRTANCLAATRSVHMCWLRECNDCNLYTSCGTRLDNGFCFTPDTNAIRLPVYVNETRPSSSITILPSSSDPFPSRSTTTSLGISPSASATENRSSGVVLPVGAIVGIALGSLAIVLATALFILWLRRQPKREELPQHSVTPAAFVHPPSGFTSTPTLTTTSSYPRPSGSASAPSMAPSSSSGWSGPGLPPSQGYVMTKGQSAHSHSTSESFSSSSGTVPSQRPAHILDIIHEDSGVRIPSAMYRQSQPVQVVEHPPPYSTG